MDLTVYHDLNVCYYGRPMLNIYIKKEKKLDHNKGCDHFYMLLILIMNKNETLQPNTSYYQPKPV